MGDSSPLDVSSDQSDSASDQVSQCSEYNPEDDSDVVVISSSDDSDGEGELSDAEIDHESVDEEPRVTATEEAQFDKVMKIISGGADLNGLRLEECKAYLRKHGLRLTGTKSTCIQRIQEHIKIKDGCGQKIYPRSSFVINCTGDVCTGDVVLFSQKVYEKFDIVTRGGAHPPLGKRTIAGRVVKESYGAAKQQHTFTVEILWSTGVKALPPLYPLLIKGRNLYRLRTYRQPWPNEAERAKILAEKHARGAEARNIRAAVKARRYGSKGNKRSQNSHTSEPPRKQRKLVKLQGGSTSEKHRLNQTRSCKSQQPHKKEIGPNTNGRPSPTSPLPVRAGHIEISGATMPATNSTQICSTGNSHILPNFDREYDQLHGDEICKQQMGRPAGTQTMYQRLVNADAQRLGKIIPAANYQFGSTIRSPSEPHRIPSPVWMPFNPVTNGSFLPSFNGNARGVSAGLHGNPSSISFHGNPRGISGRFHGNPSSSSFHGNARGVSEGLHGNPSSSFHGNPRDISEGSHGNLRGISFRGNPTTPRPGAFMPPQGNLERSHIAMQSHLHAGVPNIQAPSRIPVGSFACSSSGCHDLGARDCVNSACSQCCKRIGRKCKRHRIF